MIRYHDALARLVQHAAMDCGLFRIICGKTMLGMNSINTYENFVHKYFAGVALRGVPHHREPIATEIPPGYEHLDIRQVAELHCDVHRIGYNRDPFPMT